ncbi:prophage tail fiber assembly protein [Anaeramoeba flamelloides]|uniref:Prophage tail fiber assembly protein n=1 Tax=Anaeramoeba flamelloides TaxID=1746091 RepID=A0AAV7ZYA0_9EUKA|nr:prophage tail fiber assembly protein [Anaeramoeba flamelloides]
MTNEGPFPLSSVKFFLRDISRGMIKSWEEVFSDVSNFDISYGDYFGKTADAIISPANSFGSMDGGVDQRITDYFGWQLQDRLREKIQNSLHGELPVGKAYIIDTRTKFSKIKYCISAPTMRVPKDVSTSMKAYLAFRACLIAIEEHNKRAFQESENEKKKKKKKKIY